MNKEGKMLRWNKVFPIKYGSCYPGRDFCDMVFSYPPSHGEKIKKRLWMLTSGKAPLVKIDNVEFKPLNKSGGKNVWVDYGTTESSLNGVNEGFSQLRIFGINPEQMNDSYFIVTVQTEKELSGTIEDAYLQLFGIKRSDAGEVYINPSSLEAGKPTKFNLIYRASDKKALPAGSYIKFSVPTSMAQPQNKDRQKDGWTEIVLADSSDVELFSIKQSDESLGYFDIIYCLKNGLDAGGKIHLRYRTDFTFVFTADYVETERLYWYSKIPPLATEVAIDERKLFVSTSPEKSFNVSFKAGPAEKLHLFLPGRRKEGETIWLTGIATDRFRNISDKNWQADMVIEIDGPDKKEIRNFQGSFTHRHRFSIPMKMEKEGIYRASAFDRTTGRLLAFSNPLEITGQKSSKENIYWGEIHGHGQMSDGIGDFEDMLAKAEETGLDFAAGADHACYLTDNQWEWMQDVINRFNKPGVFCTLIGYEWAGKQGHRNIYTSEDRLKLFRGMYEPESELKVLYEHFRHNDKIVAGPHTKHAGISIAFKSSKKFWEYHDPSVEKFFEIYSIWGIYEESAHMVLNEGAMVGFTGGGDYHSGRCYFSTEVKDGQGKVPHSFAIGSLYKCGVTGCFASQLERKQIIEGLRNRRTYATTGAKILIDFNISGIPMGMEGETDKPLIKAEIHGCDSLSKIEVIRNGQIIHTEKCGLLDVNIEWEDMKPLEKSWYYLKVYQKDGEMAWTSPVWIIYKN